MRRASLLAIVTCLASLAVGQGQNSTVETPLVVAHRGFPSLIPEETIAGYQKAADVGTNYLEMDIVSTKDGVLVLRHDLYLDDTTDVRSHPEFAGRNKTVFLPYEKVNQTGYFIADFTLAELRTLYMKNPFAFRDQSLNQMYRIVTFDEILEFGAQLRDQGKDIGLYVETKGVEYHDQAGLGLERPLMQSIAKSRLAPVADQVIILQSFENASLPKMAAIGTELGLKTFPLVFLLDQQPDNCQPNITDAQLQLLPSMGIKYIGPWKDTLVNGYVYDAACNRVNTTSPTGGCASQKNQTCTGRLRPEFAAAYNGSRPYPETLVSKAHALGIGVHPYTFRNEAQYMALDFNNDPLEELRFFGPEGLGVDGYFGDNARTMVSYVKSMTNEEYDSGLTFSLNPLLPASA